MEKLDLVVIGAGPAGLSAAVEAERHGLKMTVLEKGPSHSMMIRTFYKEGKRVDAVYAGQEAICFGLLCLRDGNRESFLAYMDHVIQHHKIPIEYQTEVWTVQKQPDESFEVKASNGKTYVCKYVVVAIGKMGRPQQPSYFKELPVSLKRNGSLLFDINSQPLDGKKVLVVGGGDSATEYAHMLSEKSEVTLSYRQKSFHRVNEINLKNLQDIIDRKKIRVLLGSNIRTIEDRNEKPHVIFTEPEFAAETFDAVLYGLGGMTPIEFMRTAQVKMSERGEAVTNEFCESSVPKLYVVGDLVGKGHGGGSIISGFNSGSRAVRDLLARYEQRALQPDVVELDHLKY